MTRITHPKQGGRLLSWLDGLFEQVERAQRWEATEISEPEVTEVDAAEFYRAELVQELRA